MLNAETKKARKPFDSFAAYLVEQNIIGEMTGYSMVAASGSMSARDREAVYQRLILSMGARIEKLCELLDEQEAEIAELKAG